MFSGNRYLTKRIHEEVPPYEKCYQFAVPFSPVTAKIYVIAEYDANQKPYATMLFAEEY